RGHRAVRARRRARVARGRLARRRGGVAMAGRPAGRATPFETLRRLSGGRTSLFANSLAIMVTTGANLILGFAFWVIAARTTNQNAVGLTSAVISAMTLASTIGSIGVGS